MHLKCAFLTYVEVIFMNLQFYSCITFPLTFILTSVLLDDEDAVWKRNKKTKTAVCVLLLMCVHLALLPSSTRKIEMSFVMFKSNSMENSMENMSVLTLENVTARQSKAVKFI